MRSWIERYVRNCHVCRRSKTFKNKYSDMLNSFSISNRSWIDITMNFVIDLSITRDDLFNVLLMIICRLNKMHYYIFCFSENKDTSTKKTAKILLNKTWKLHELFTFIISNRESQFVVETWKALCDFLKIKIKLFTVFHSKTNDQSEIANQEMKRYLKSYCDYQQSN